MRRGERKKGKHGAKIEKEPRECFNVP